MTNESYDELIAKIGGEVITIDPQHTTSINPLDYFINAELNETFEVSLQNMYEFIETLQNVKEITPVEKDALYKIFVKNINKESKLQIIDIYKELLIQKNK